MFCFQVHVGCNILIPCSKLKFVFKATCDSKCAKDASRTIWTTPQLLERSVSGRPCNRFKKLGAQGKIPMTPEKKIAVRNMLEKYIRDHPTQQETKIMLDKELKPEEKAVATAKIRADRLKNTNKYISELVNDLTKKHRIKRALLAEQSELPGSDCA
ncbi:uncharacterized protein LOC121838496 [Ixodes scapularis]|uniref:uncharacterized protein LOC121838496 n=1 Tax=Ixodes scapularis TaxID=6945 RepID=UPI001A9D3245|nr:uncharacterized protein LOC121838496 [Ixodes scapularis]